MTSDEQAIRDLVKTWFDASMRGDTATVLSLMTDDVVFMVPGREPFGKDAFRNQSNQLQDTKISGTSDIVELQVLGDWAYMRSKISVTMTPPNGDSNTRSGYTLTIFRKESDGKWRLHRDANLLR